jgi:hypothetical protein
MAAAWSALDPNLQERIAGLVAIHVCGSHSARQLMALSDANKERVPNAVLHPLVRTHPENGRKSIYITRSASKASSAWTTGGACRFSTTCCGTPRPNGSSTAIAGSRATS